MKELGAAALLGLAVSLAMAAPAQAQIHGTPPSVTSLGRSKTFFNPPGVPASVTSLGPAGFQTKRFCCGPFFGGKVGFGHHPKFHLKFGHFRSRFRHGLPVFVPVYVPYYPYAPVMYVAQPDPEVVEGGEPLRVESRRRRETYVDDFEERRERGLREDKEDRIAEEQRPAPPAPPPAEQDPTVLVFRDGRQREVRNYAIVGPTLYDFAGGRGRKVALAELDLDATRQVNEERGVYFYLPSEQATP